MLLNFLIALYSDKMKTITQHREVITVSRKVRQVYEWSADIL